MRGPNMARVTTEEALSYGGHLFGYMFTVGLIAGSVGLFGILEIREPPLQAAFIFIAVIIGFLALPGMLYKIIADAVARGNEPAE